jgi:malonyl-CoA decarboxylase
VHEIQGWDDLRRRLAPDRRCFGFFHPALPGEPLIFVEVALVQGLAAAVQPLLARDDGDAQTACARAAHADTAIFYSISNCQEGLRGVSFGNLLIKQVVEELRSALPQLKRFSTLSPVPGFRRWLEKQVGAGLAPAGLLAPVETANWWQDAARAEAVRRPLLRLCATYLAGAGGPKESADSVARFHLSNGARLERVNWLGNVAPRGMQESYGIMVNYLYDPETIEANHEAFAQDGTVVRSPEVDALMVAAASPVGTAAS